MLSLYIYNSSYNKTWNDYLSYIYHIYNIEVHLSMEVSPFKACMGFLPKSPIDLQLTALSSFDSTSTFEHHGHEKYNHLI